MTLTASAYVLNANLAQTFKAKSDREIARQQSSILDFISFVMWGCTHSYRVSW